MENKKTLLKNAIWINILAGFVCLIASLFLIIPVYYASVIIFSLVNASGNKESSTTALVLAILLIITTLSKVALSITTIVFGFKTRKLSKKDHSEYLNKLKTPLTMLIINLVLIVMIIVSLCLKLTIKFIMWVDVLSIALFSVASILLIIELVKRKKEHKSLNSVKQDL